MLQAITPIDAEWMHAFVVQPFAEGAERLDRAWLGINTFSVNPTHLTLEERVISLIAGMCLMLPLINTIIWIAWQTFGKPERLTTRFCSTTEPAPTRPIPSASSSYAAPVASSLDEAVKPSEYFVYEITHTSGVTSMTWQLDWLSECTVERQCYGPFSSNSYFLPDGTLLHYDCTAPPNHILSVERTQPHLLQVRWEEGGEKTTKDCILEPVLPWLQPTRWGLKPFLLSAQQEFRFYIIMPVNPFRKYIPWAIKPPFAMPVIAKKVGSDVDGFGQLMKVELKSAWGWPYSIPTITLWFDPQTNLRKFAISFGPKGKYVPDHLSPAQAHQ